MLPLKSCLNDNLVCTRKVLLSKEDAIYLENVKKHIENLVEDDKCPSRINSKICRKCSYYDFCYVEEV